MTLDHAPRLAANMPHTDSGATHTADARPDMPVLEVADLTVAYHGAVKVEPTSFTVRRGERLAIVGESGSGKSSIANAIGGFISPEAGTVSATTLTCMGRSLLDAPAKRIPARREGISMIFQDAMSSLDPVWSVGSQLLAVLPSARHGSRRARRGIAEERLRQVGITDPRRVMGALPEQLSGGMRQRVMMAIALAGEPELLIADEPTSALDVTLAITVMELLTGLAADEGAALVFISHDLPLSRKYCDRMLVMRAGRIVEHLDPEHVTDATDPYTRGLFACMPTLQSCDRDRLPTVDDLTRAEMVA
ncbi:ABC transporter ATP-binding protein [Gordonia sp. N1V]|uniref:ABC transporter ATP-binding protein n=1 Tax=Gordonia sp. N1V TaxID=3034163 RepID=UPI0023E16B03|nr:ABC transporter ATP-binding protein [Gordonia sp. N1V]MDF3284629.1 ABC transporter ATP-binding protein [Gordonia sp. N1V]